MLTDTFQSYEPGDRLDDNVFGGGSERPVAITILVRDPGRAGPARIHYTEIGDYLTREQKLAAVADAESVAAPRSALRRR